MSASSLSESFARSFDEPALERSARRGAKESFRISDLTRELGVTARTLRFYEERGLVTPKRVGRDRIYSRRDRARLKYVLLGKAVGFSLDDVREMLDLYDLGDRQVTQLGVALTKFDERIARLMQQRAEIDRVVGELAKARETIASMLVERGSRRS